MINSSGVGKAFGMEDGCIVSLKSLLCDSSGINPELTAEQFPSLHSEHSWLCVPSAPQLWNEQCQLQMGHIKHKLLFCPERRRIWVTKAGTSRAKCAFMCFKSYKCLLGGVWTTVVGLSRAGSAPVAYSGWNTSAKRGLGVSGSASPCPRFHL